MRNFPDLDIMESRNLFRSSRTLQGYITIARWRWSWLPPKFRIRALVHVHFEDRIIKKTLQCNICSRPVLHVPINTRVFDLEVSLRLVPFLNSIQVLELVSAQTRLAERCILLCLPGRAKLKDELMGEKNNSMFGALAVVLTVSS